MIICKKTIFILNIRRKWLFSFFIFNIQIFILFSYQYSFYWPRLYNWFDCISFLNWSYFLWKNKQYVKQSCYFFSTRKLLIKYIIINKFIHRYQVSLIVLICILLLFLFFFYFSTINTIYNKGICNIKV